MLTTNGVNNSFTIFTDTFCLKILVGRNKKWIKRIFFATAQK